VVVQDYARLFGGDPALAAPAAKAAALAQDVTALLAALPLRKAAGPRPAIIVQAPCSLQHGLRKPGAGEALLAGLGFPVATPADGHLCCGSAGVYNILQPEMAEELRTRKIAALRGAGARIVASANISCMTQLARGTDLVLVHTVELADWATGGPRPISLEGIA
jgi:glycolate oxidase iron-sulfur subunit